MTPSIFKSLKSLIKNKFKWCTPCCPHYKNNSNNRRNSYKILLNDIDTLDTLDTHIISNPTFTFSYPHDIGVNNKLYIEYDAHDTNNDTFY